MPPPFLLCRTVPLNLSLEPFPEDQRFRRLAFPKMPPRRSVVAAKARARAVAKRRSAPVAKAHARAEAKRAVSLGASNARLRSRRVALQTLNGILRELGHAPLCVKAKEPDPAALRKVFWFFARRPLQGATEDQCRAAIQQYCDNGGALPESLSISAEGNGVVGPEEAVPVIPGHTVLKSSFRLHSRAFMVTYNSDDFIPATWPAFHAWTKSFARSHGSRAWAACLEESLHAGTPGQQRFHLHAYFIWLDDVGLSLRSLESLRFEGVRPRVDVCKPSMQGTASGLPRKAALHGLWYVTVCKEGTRNHATNFEPWVKYSPNMAWLGGLWDAKKLSHGRFQELSAEFRTGHSKRKRDLTEVQRAELEAAVHAHVAAEEAELAAKTPLTEFKVFPKIEEFVANFQQPARRRPLLVFVGGTGKGKSLLAGHVLQKVAKVLSVKDFLEVTVEDDSELDFSEFDHRRHAGVLLDGVGDALMLWRRREVLQGRAKVCHGGKSSTMMYAYPYTLARRAVVVTMDLSARNLHLLHTNHWLKDPANVRCVWLTEPAWVQVGGALQRTPSPEARMLEFTVQEVASFFEGRDACALARVLEQNGVNGADLAMFTCANELVQDLHFTPFAARKILSLREAFLAQ